MNYILLPAACMIILFDFIAFPLWAGPPLELKVAEEALALDSIELAIKNGKTGRLQHVRIRWGKKLDVALDDAHMPRRLLDEVRKYTIGTVLSPVNVELNQSNYGNKTMREVDVAFFVISFEKDKAGTSRGNLIDNEQIENPVCPNIKKITIHVNLDWKTFSASIQCGAEIIFIRCPEVAPCH